VRGPAFLQKSSRTLVESTRSLGLLSGFFFAKKPSDFTEINPQSRPFKWVGLPPCGPVYHVPGPYWAEFGPTMFSYFPTNLLFIYNGSNFIKNIIKQIKIKKCKTKFVELYTTSTAL
jgi:hypothetical protein